MRGRVRTRRALRGAAWISTPAAAGMSRIVRPSISTLTGALDGARSMRMLSLPSVTSERSGLPWVASGVRTIASRLGATAGPPAPTV